MINHLPLENKLTQYFEREKQRAIEECKACGVCAKKCPILCHTALSEISPKQIQKTIKEFLENGNAHDTVFTRAFSCWLPKPLGLKEKINSKNTFNGKIWKGFWKMPGTLSTIPPILLKQSRKRLMISLWSVCVIDV